MSGSDLTERQRQLAAMLPELWYAAVIQCARCGMHVLPGGRCADCGRRDWMHHVRRFRVRIGHRLERFGRWLGTCGSFPMHAALIDYRRISTDGKAWVLVEPFTSRVVAEGDTPLEACARETIPMAHESGWILTKRPVGSVPIPDNFGEPSPEDSE